MKASIPKTAKDIELWAAQAPDAPVSPEELIWAWLRQGWTYRWARNIHMHSRVKEYKARIDMEMGLIVEKGFINYFLMLSDVCRFAKDEGVPVGPARGSAAASLVCYLLRITEVDPMMFPTMLFERFIDINRTDLPDVDLDFDDEQRYKIRDRLVARYGADHVGNLGAYTRYRGKNSVVDVCRVYQIPKWSQEIVKGLIIERSGGDSRFDASLEDTFEMFPKAAEQLEKYPDYAQAIRLEGNYKGLTVHAAGLVVCNSPINDFCATYARVVKGHEVEVVSVDKYDAEPLGLLKADFLGLTTMGMIRLCLEMIGMPLDDLYQVPLDDPETIEAFNVCDVVGIFQFEGRATRLVTQDVVPTSFMELADINALSRPGPLFSGATAAYVASKHGRPLPHHVASIKGLSPLVDKIVEPTYYQIVYQEQILLICGEVGDLGWVHRNAIRTIISKKKGEGAFNALQGEFIAGAARKGVEADMALEIWKRMVTAGTYAFNIAHCTTGDTLIYRNRRADSVPISFIYNAIHNYTVRKPCGPMYKPEPRPERCVSCGEKPATGHLECGDQCLTCSHIRGQVRTGRYNVLSLGADGLVRPAAIKAVHRFPAQPLLAVSLDTGTMIRATPDHRWMRTDRTWVRADELVGGEELIAWDWDTPYGNTPKPRGPNYWAMKRDKSTGDVCAFCGERPVYRSGWGLDVAHLDGTYDNDDPENLVYLCRSCHVDWDMNHCEFNRRSRGPWSVGKAPIAARVISVEPTEAEETYTLEMADASQPNYISGGLVSHNCLSYSMLGFWQMYLKVHHPREFYAAQLQKTPKEKWPRLLKDAERHGIAILPPDLNDSGRTWSRTTNGDGQPAVRAGYEQIPGIGEKTAEAILTQRREAFDGNFNSWEDLITVRGIGPKSMAKIRAFCYSTDPWGLDHAHRVLEEVRGMLARRELGPVPRPTHTSDEMDPNGKHQVVFVGIPHSKNYQDYAENQRARTGEELEDVMARITHKDRLTSCVVHCHDDGDEDVYLRFERVTAFPRHKSDLEDLAVNGTSVVIVAGTKVDGFGVAIKVDRMWVLDITDDEPDDPDEQRALALEGDAG